MSDRQLYNYSVSSNHDYRQAHHLNSHFYHYCEKCDRPFQSPAALRGHRETHEPRDIQCPSCNRGFPTLSALAKHVELGKCYGPLSHPEFVTKVRDWEARTGNPNLLTVPRLGHGDNGTSYGPVEATGATYNGYAFQCYFCVRQFKSLVSLNQHLNSGVHLPKEFRCPKCGFTATWLSGVIAHIESEKCGLMKRSQVRSMASPFSCLQITGT